MKATFVFLVLFAAAGAVAQETEPPPVEQPDYSRESLQRFVATIPEPPRRERNVTFHVGAIEFRALGTRWRFNYIPIMRPFSGTEMSAGMAVTQTFPDPFALTGTSIAMSPRAWRTQRAINSEMRRIEETERAKLRVKTQ